MRDVARVFIKIGMYAGIIFVFPFIIGRKKLRKMDAGEPLTTGDKVIILMFVNTIGGILLLCEGEDAPAAPAPAYESYSAPAKAVESAAPVRPAEPVAPVKPAPAVYAPAPATNATVYAPVSAPKPAEPVAPAVPKASELHCPACGAKLVAGAAFCSACGKKIPPAKNFCLTCGTELPANAAFCHKCGAKQ